MTVEAELNDEMFKRLKLHNSTENFAGHPGTQRLLAMYKLEYPEDSIKIEKVAKYVRACPVVSVKY